MGIKIKGLRDIERKLDKLAEKAKSLEGTNHVPLSELFPPSFMQRYTSFETLESMFASGGFSANTQEVWNAISPERLDVFVAQHTSFGSWQEMMSTAGSAWAGRQLGLS